MYLQTFLKKLLSVWHLLLSASLLNFGISSHRRWQLNTSETSLARCSFVSLSEPHWNQVKSEKSRCSAVRRPSKQHYKHRIASSCQPLLTGRSTQTNFRPESMWDEEELTSMWSSFKTAQSWIDVADIRKSTKKSTGMSSPKSAVFITQEVTWRALRDAPKRWMSMKPTHRAGWSIEWVRAVLSSSISSQRRCRQEAGGLTLLLNHRTQRSQSSSNQCCQCVCAVIQNLWLMAPCRTNRESVCVFPSLFFSLWVCENLATLHHYRLRGKHHCQGRYRPSALRCAFLLRTSADTVSLMICDWLHRAQFVSAVHQNVAPQTLGESRETHRPGTALESVCFDSPGASQRSELLTQTWLALFQWLSLNRDTQIIHRSDQHAALNTSS